MSYTDSDKVILLHELETTNVSKCPHLLHWQPARLELIAELLTIGVAHSADILADARDVAFEVLPLLH